VGDVLDQHLGQLRLGLLLALILERFSPTRTTRILSLSDDLPIAPSRPRGRPPPSPPTSSPAASSICSSAGLVALSIANVCWRWASTDAARTAHLAGGSCEPNHTPDKAETSLDPTSKDATMTYRIATTSALEILDSRGRPTLEVTVNLDTGASGTAGVPSGASTGTREAVELRDGDPSRYRGAGVTTAVGHVNLDINGAVSGRDWQSLAEIDGALVELDGTETKSRLGANAIVGVSMAAARAMAAADSAPLYRWLATDDTGLRMPVPHFNVINGGAHAQNPLEFQEFMIAPLGAANFAEALRIGAECYQTLRGLLHERGHSTGLGDEGGFAPDLATPEEVLDMLVEAISAAGYTPGIDGIAIALDPAASEFRQPDGRYRYTPDQHFSTAEMIDRYTSLVDRYPIWSIEDGLAEDDWDGWEQLTARLGSRVQLVGDDIFVTNPAIIGQAIDRKIANSALIKLNQIGTVTETLDAMAVCRRAGYTQMVSHRSGETADTFIADLAVATGCGQLKSGAPARGERIAKYNRLLAIEVETGGTGYGLSNHP
jgi:enolase